METFGYYIKRLRLQKGLNQTELAAIVGLDTGGLSKIENNKKSLKEKKLSSFAQALDVDLNELKNQYLSEKFALDSCKYKVSNKVFQLAEEKANYYNQNNVKQGNLDL
jgi:transcriptional regulator with XRE-family HTH domain